MHTVSRKTRQKSWQTGRTRVSLLAEMALRQEKVSQRLAELRERNALTQEQAAAKIGVTLRQWQRWEAGESMPYPRNLDLIASRFGMEISEFFDNGDEPGGTQLDRVEALLEAQALRMNALEASVTELRAAVVELSADSLRQTRERLERPGTDLPQERPGDAG